jgi:hypothetical protein
VIIASVNKIILGTKLKKASISFDAKVNMQLVVNVTLKSLPNLRIRDM